ncbi:MAG: hypothetical protein RMI94_06565 [Bryobacterales bacterium]|nr:hypothetical protein [Bryobacteraceae bacterium]MDW8130194.1 hypothetical protein [Bryobacterales bacterium]
MGAARWWPAVAALGSVLWAGGGETRGAPSYSGAGIVNAASNAPGPLAPNAIASLYGKELAFSTRALADRDIRLNQLPTELDGVRVLVGGLAAPLYYVSPSQINFLVPYILGARFPTEVSLVVARHGIAGPQVRFTLEEAAPALFQLDAETPIVTTVRKEGDTNKVAVISKDEPAQPEEWITLWATGLGRTEPSIDWPYLPAQAFRIANWRRFQVLLDGAPISADRIQYVGVAPGFGGLYQVNLRLPDDIEGRPEIRIAVGEAISPPGLRLPVRKPPR